MTETYGYDKTPTPPRDYDASKVPPEIKKRATWVKTKFTGEDVAEAYGQAMEITGIYSDEAKKIAQQTKVRQDNLETQTAQSVAQMEADKNTIVANATVDSEVILARGGKATLGQRLDETTAQLAQKATLDQIWNMPNMGQDVKEAMTGGSVAVVGVDGVIGRVNIVDTTVTPKKIFSRKTNPLFNLVSPYDYYENKTIDDSGIIVDGTYVLYKDIPVKAGESYSTLGNTVRKVHQYDESGVYHGVVATSLSSSGGEFEATHDGIVHFETTNIPTRYFTVKETSKFNGQHIDYKETDNLLTLTENNMSNNMIVDSHVDYKALSLDIVNFIKSGTNKFNKDDVEDGVILTSSGTSPNTKFFSSRYMRFGEEQKITISHCRLYQIFDTNKNIQASENTGSDTATITLTIPKDGLLRFSGNIANLSVTQINLGDVLLPFEDYANVLDDSIHLKSGQIIGEIDGQKPIQLKRNGSQATISSTKGMDTIEHTIDLNGSKNNTLNFIDVRLNGLVIHSVGDDITPIRTVSTVGANHGYTESVVGNAFPENMENGQLYPSVKNVTQEIDEKYDRIVITESYEILDHQSLLDWKTSNPTGDYTTDLNNIESVVKIVIQYTFYGFGKCNVDTTLIFMKDTEIANVGFLQSARLDTNAIRFMPNINVAGYDFQSGVPLSDYAVNTNVTAGNLTYPNEPPLYYTDKKDDVRYSMGYLPEQDATSEIRLQQTNVFWDLRSTGKSYPVALNTKSSPIQSGTIFQVSGFRNYTLNENDLTTFEVVESGGYWYVYIASLTSHDVINRILPIPTGKSIETVVNHGVTLLKDKTGGGGITFSTSEKSNAIFRVAK